MLSKRRVAVSLMTVRRTVLAVGALGVVLTVPSSASALGRGAAKTVRERVTLTQVFFQTSSTGNPPLSGANSGVGISDGRIGRVAVRGAVRGTNIYPAFTGNWIMFYPEGTIKFSLKGHVVSPGSFAGSARITGGTGTYRNARGTMTFTAVVHTGPPVGGQSSPVFVRNMSGTLILP